MSKQYSCVINVYATPVRVASSKVEFIENILTEYNNALDGLVTLSPSDIREVSIECEEKIL
tara:strand:+ start:309 stop:491 length:183 start_codon:yes stop_codon:yes gene_type:complete